jgi:ubiquinone/menaquinone biosynthesis C-methylase UbiE
MRALIAVVTLVALTCAAVPAAAQAPAPHGRLFAPLNLGLLEGPDRDLWQMPGQIMDALGIAERSVVADIGAGGGWFTIRLARRVGPNGIVFSEDIQRQMLEATGRRIAREGLRNVQTVLGTSEDPGLPAGEVDAALIVDTYHELENPVALLRNLARALKPQGRIGVIDFKKDGLGPGPALEDRVEPELIVHDAELAGLRVVRTETFLPYQFLLIFARKQ